ncbi:phosphate signaling complex protein PhoU [Syntrophobacter fumaroxidans]|uniref:Phosphate-specific transport system accessory protein PhoU n=1 Tax=Syntrophobacter fumaroxidans (strain DSM 10017 / MPOB) TaxID=335543 RepID=A0LMB4_SYNFM|nr:phosphate signaling complex protein PhoU [Syntrophobacter fumaroxidans]ABK18566.1 phosphate uptake regulator, PhoU [Syntrophobacter fumaroxidans MPOB]ABK18581.1 phosphate uptake regulator, PhoU [Syntrophobacter fumaroxidans MPOB]HOI96051.1 phosphate signaling complex protein PhoU [Syntrophobacter fumaroxidans]HOI96057.1 phosphate signaling complex protein PhoU [Syntrophobacter fumaroxidans]
MESRFLKELDRLRMIILEMAARTETALEKSAKAFFERDVELAEEVIRGDDAINRLEVDVDRLSLRLLALEQPMARDLRFIVGCMRIAVELERIADLAVNVARRGVFMSRRPPLPPNASLEQLATTALDMLRTVIDSFVRQNADEAREVCQMDDTADDLNVKVLKSLLDHMVKEAPAVERSVQTIIVSRCLERVADQTTNIAESVIFMVLGVNIKHHCE